MTIFCFVDTETTGLSPKDDYLLEVAWTLTLSDFTPLFEPRSFLVDQGEKTISAVQRVMENPYVLNMHNQSGLLDDLSTGELTSVEDIVDEFRDDVLTYRSNEDGPTTDLVHLAGYSVGFDREFLRANGWSELLTSGYDGVQINHRLLDLSATTLLLNTIHGLYVPRPHNPNPHRAVTDVMETVEYAQSLRRVLGS